MKKICRLISVLKFFISGFSSIMLREYRQDVPDVAEKTLLYYIEEKSKYRGQIPLTVSGAGK